MIRLNAARKTVESFFFVDDESNKNLTEEVQQAKREGLIDAFLFDSVSENYFASVIDSV